VPAIKGIDDDGNEVVRKADDKEPLALLAFKIMDDPFVGTITFCRIYSGVLVSGTGVINSTRDKKERIGRMLLMHANNREDIKEAYAGDIVALAGLKEVAPATRCAIRSSGHPRKMEFPEPVIEIAIEPKTKADQEKMGVALAKLANEDPSFRVSTDQSPARPSQGHGRTASRHQGRPLRASSRSTPTSARRRWPSARRSPSRPRSTTPTRSRPAVPASSLVSLVVEPNEPGGLRVRVEDRRRCGSEGIHPRRRKGSTASWGRACRRLPGGGRQGRPVDGAYHDVDSSALAFEIASRAAFREALQKAKSVLLEPIMKVEVVTPEDYTGSVIGDLNSRRGQIQGQDMRGNANVINAMVPLANMFGYVNNLRSMSQGRATFTMQFDHYAEAPANVSAEVQKKFA
jgi:elongation factor G